MNLFQQYGIKEVADVVFYSINKIGDEEFYTPVLYLDTLKVSTIEKTAQKVSAQGGLGNKKLITWNYGKELTLNLEDALFSPASMSMIWGGVLNSVLSDITSTIVKCNVANRYGEKNYSTKAYPSPALNDRELKLLYNAASQCSYDILDDKITEQMKNKIKGAMNNNSTNLQINIKEGAGSFVKKGSDERDKESEVTFSISSFPMTDAQQKQITSIVQEMMTNKLMKYSKVSVRVNTVCGYAEWDKLNKQIDLSPASEQGTNVAVFELVYQEGSNTSGNYGFLQPFTTEADIYNADGYSKDEQKELTDEQKETIIKKHSLFVNMTNTYASNTITEDTWEQRIKTNYDDGPISSYLQQLLLKKYYSRLPQATTSVDNHNEAMPQSIINTLMTMLHTFDDIGKIETEMYDIEVLDRMEKCIVKSRHGFTISRKQQLNNLRRYYLDDRTSSYTIYYDPKTMLPLLPYVSDSNDFGTMQIDATTGQVKDIVDSKGNSIDKFKIKVGTVYYKWTRSVKYKSNDDTGILGRSFVIDAETFPDYYKIVGETYIRNRKTGKDQRYQFIINRAQVSADTNITLEAEGDPTTFSMQIDVLTPPNDVMMELKQYDVEEDKINGGFSVVPQKSEYTYTPAWKEPENMLAPKNDEVY